MEVKFGRVLNMNKRITKFKIVLKQNLVLFLILSLWYIINYIVFYIITGYNPSKALQYTFYLAELPEYGFFYATISGFLIFSWIFTLITIDLYRKYHPIQMCIKISKSMKNHTIIIGYSHLGQRVREYIDRLNKTYVIIEDDRILTEDLIDEEEPIVPKKAYDPEIIEDANVRDAKLVLITKNDLETLVVATHNIRAENKDCKIICRCFDDAIAKILEKQLKCETISTSRYACQMISSKIKEWGSKDAVLIGCNHITRRLMRKFKAIKLPYKIIEKNRDVVEDIIDEEPIIIGDAKDSDILKEAGVSTTNLIITLMDEVEEVLLITDEIREINKNSHLICRIFHDEVAEVLEKPPFNAHIISTSKNTLQKLIETGIFDQL